MGCRKIAEQISSAFGLEINKDVVRRILIQHYRPAPGGAGPSWLSVIGQARDSLWSVDLFRCESILLQSYWVMVVMDIFTRRIIGFGVAAANLDGPGMCRMFNRAIARQSMPKQLSSDHDPLFRFQRWQANLRILEIDEIKSIPGTPRSHAFIERLIGTIGANTSIRLCFGTKAIWNGSSIATRFTTTDIAAKLDWPASPQFSVVALLPIQSQTLTHTAGENTATASLRPRPPPELYLATHKLGLVQYASNWSLVEHPGT
jgi:transposase InsO family protein